MSGNRERYEKKRNRSQDNASQASQDSKVNKGKEALQSLRDKYSQRSKSVNIEPESDFDENEYFGNSSAPKVDKPRAEKGKNLESAEKRPGQYFSSFASKLKGSISKGGSTNSAPSAKSGGEARKTTGHSSPRRANFRANGVRSFLQIPVLIAVVSGVLLISGVVLAVLPGDKSKASQPVVQVQDIFPVNTFTYEQGLVTMGLASEGDVAAGANNYMVPPKPKEYDPIVYSYPAAGKRVALTFDDGPSHEMSDDYIKVLDDNNVKATFFLLAKNVAAFPEQAKQLQEAGHDIASHSLNHSVLSSLSTTALQEDFAKSNEIFKETVGEKPDFMRPPYGSYDDEVLATAREYGQLPIYWSIDTNDWRKYSTETMVNTIVNNLSDGAIILMHEGKSNTLEALPAIIQAIRDNGYEIVPLSQLLSY